MKIGLTQGTAEADQQDFVQFVAGLGVTGVEPYIGDAASEYLGWSQSTIEAWRRGAAAINVVVPSVAMSVFNSDASLVNGKNTAHATDLILKALRFSAAVGARTMLLCTYLASNPDSRDKQRRLVDVIRRVVSEAQRLGVTIALESPLAADPLASLVDEIASDCVGVYYDTGNAVALGFDPADELVSLGHRVVGLHLKDSTDRLGALHIGDGRVDFEEVFAAVHRIGYDGWLMLETPGDSVESVHEDIRRCLAILILHLQNQSSPGREMRTVHGR